MGVMKGRVGFTPITVKDIQFERAKELIMNKDAVVTPEVKIAKMNEKLAGFIKEKLAAYEVEWKNTKDFKSLTPDMAIPLEAMK